MPGAYRRTRARREPERSPLCAVLAEHLASIHRQGPACGRARTGFVQAPRALIREYRGHETNAALEIHERFCPREHDRRL